MATANEELFDRAVSHQIGLLRLSGGIRNKYIAHLNRVEADLVEQLKKRAGDGNVTEARLSRMLNDVRDILNEARPDGYALVRDDLVDLADYEADFQSRMISDSVPIELNLTKPSPEQLRAGVLSRPFQGKLLREWVEDLDDSTRRRVRDAIRMGWTEGETVDQMVRRIKGTRALNYRDGAMEISRRNAQTMVRTAVNHTASYARDQLYAANTDVIKAYRFVATLDGRTSERCRAADGRIFPVGGGGLMPPLHPNCRSSTAPILKSYREMGIDLDEAPRGTRASLDGQVPAETTYNDWLKRRSAAEQDDILGATKGKLFREGGLDVQSFVDERGHVYTLDELRKREAKAFERAGLNA